MHLKQKLFCHLKITDISFEEMMELIDKKIKARERLLITRLTVKNFVKSLFNPALRDALRHMDIVVPSSKFLFRLVKKIYPDYQFTLEHTKEFITPLIHKYHQFLVNFVILGGNMAGLNKLAINLKASFPGLKLIGTYPKLFLERREEDIQTVLRKSEPHVFFIGLGEDMEQLWLHNNKNIFPKTVCICVNKQINVMCHEESDIPYRYKVQNKEFLYLLQRKPYRVFDFFVWLPVWFQFGKFKHKLRKKAKRQAVK